MTPISDFFPHVALRRCDEEACNTLDKVQPLWERSMAGEGILLFEKTPDKKRILSLETNEGEVLDKVELARSLLLRGNQYWILTKCIIGCGKQTNVRICYEPSSQMMYARKRVSDPVQEVWLKRLAVSPLRGVIPIVSVQKTGKKKHFYEQCATGTLERLLRKNNFPAADRERLIGILVEMMAEFHVCRYSEIASNAEYQSHGLIHGDIKPANILYCSVEDSQGGAITLHLTDFGGINPAVLTGTPRYASPETLAARQDHNLRNSKIEWGQAADIWSLGITCLEVALGRSLKNQDLPCLTQDSNAAHALPIINERELDDQIFKLVSRESAVGKFISLALRPDWKKRITAKEALDLLSPP